jgi:hypothetical protein
MSVNKLKDMIEATVTVFVDRLPRLLELEFEGYGAVREDLKTSPRHQQEIEGTWSHSFRWRDIVN